jgi:hypothetical protein
MKEYDTRAEGWTAHRLAHCLAHSARQVYQAVVGDLERQGSRSELFHDFEALRTHLLPSLTVASFADMYAQTVVYNLFAAQVQAYGDEPEIVPSDMFSPLALLPGVCPRPMPAAITALVQECATLLRRMDLPVLFSSPDPARPYNHPCSHPLSSADPILHFYENFLAAYNPQQRQRRGVYYTPAPLVGWVVRSVEWVLNHHFCYAAGLADERVCVLDPAMGTATFLHAALRSLCDTLHKNHLAQQSTVEAMPRLPQVWGCELLVAPYAIARLKLTLLLKHYGPPFDHSLRLHVRLGNALASRAVPFCDPSSSVAPLLVILGNPPYAATSANRGLWDEQIRAHYYPRDHIKEQNPKLLLDDYVKFICYAQQHIEQAGQGVLAFVTNHSYLDTPTFRRMRESLLHTFSDIYLLNLHGNVRQQETAPDGSRDENVFDIQQGVAIGLFVKRPQSAGDAGTARVQYADVWGGRTARGGRGGKYDWLATHDVATTDWSQLSPEPPFWWFVPCNRVHMARYERWWKITDIFPLYLTGIKTHRDHFALAIERDVLLQRIADFRDLSIPDSTIRQQYGLTDTRDWHLHTRRVLLNQVENWQDYLARCLYRPFDRREIYYHPCITERTRQGVMCHMQAGPNVALMTSRQQSQHGRPWSLIFVTDSLTECCALSNKTRENGYLFPLYLYHEPVCSTSKPSLSPSPSTGGTCCTYPVRRGERARCRVPGGSGYEGCEGVKSHCPCACAAHQVPPVESSNPPIERRANLSAAFIAAVEQQTKLTCLPDGRGDLTTTIGPEDIVHYVYAFLHHPDVRQQYGEMLRRDFPHVSLASELEVWRAMVNAGAALVDQHLLRQAGQGGVCGAGGAEVLDTQDTGIRIYPDSGMCVEQVRYYASGQGYGPGRVVTGRGACIEGVEADVWEMRVGSYQPLRKWLVDRRGRVLYPDDVRHYARMVAALRETCRIVGVIGTIPNWR